MKRKPWAALAALLALMLMLAACGGQSGGGANGGDTVPAGEGGASAEGGKADPVTIRFSWWGSGPRHEATLAAIEKYMELNPYVKVEAEYMGFDGYSKKLATQFAGDSAPDLFQYVNSFNDQLGDYLMDLKQAEIDTSTFPESALRDFATYEDKLIFIPTGQDTFGAIYNEAFFEKHGIPQDKSWTWDSLIEIGKKVHETDPDDYLLTADIDVIEREIIIPYVTQRTGKIWINDDFTPNFTEQDLEGAYSYLLQLYENGVMEPFGNSTAFVGKMEQNPKWVNGEIGMLFDYAGAFGKYEQSVSGASISIGPFPEHPDAKQSANPITAGTGFAINDSSKVKEETAKLLDWLVNDPEAAVILNTQRGIPASGKALEALGASGQLKPEIKAAVEYAGTRTALPITVLSDNASIRVAHEDAIQKVIYKKLTPQQGAAEAMANIKEKLEELKAEAR
ncbi:MULTISPECIES: ABC transporter substrate-binding protein [Cohnella]|uniref:ABC transporter substrate-binding protein n=1 Tax=Cohnella TaxID=329857 RepID=UPI0009B9C165|nr:MULTISPECIES: extracellular solute-binding protein [Cohnella]MBN2983017.1 extracellular solute-binding protein [Cohnella algarum]